MTSTRHTVTIPAAGPPIPCTNCGEQEPREALTPDGEGGGLCGRCACTCSTTVYCAPCGEADDAMMAASGMTHCWVCDALAPAITDETGATIGTRCGCDDHPYADGADGVNR